MNFVGLGEVIQTHQRHAERPVVSPGVSQFLAQTVVQILAIEQARQRVEEMCIRDRPLNMRIFEKRAFFKEAQSIQ